MPSIIEQLHRAYRRTGWPMAELLRRSGLRLHRATLARKLVSDGRKGRGRRTAMRTEEAEALARAMGVTLVVMPDSDDGAQLGNPVARE